MKRRGTRREDEGRGVKMRSRGRKRRCRKGEKE
jgi:hypothetical protein